MFREQIRKHYDHLSRSYRRVADFILNDYRTAAFMTAASLADTVDVDTTTVVRFAQRLGYPGFPDLIEDVQRLVKLELNQEFGAVPEEDSAEASVQRLIAADRGNLDKAMAHNSLEMFERIFDFFRVAPHIYILGESFAMPLADSFAGMLRESGLPVVTVSTDIYDRARSLSHLTRKDLVLGITPIEGEAGVAKALAFAREEGAITLACSPSLNSQAARSAEHLLYAPGETTSALPSLTGMYSILMAIAQTVATSRAEAPDTRLQEINRAMEHLS
jgi:DNA-binding MurR/RpiR family transcriptional regulator